MKKAYFYAFSAIACWSTMATISKILLTNLNNFQLLWASSFFAGIFLLIVNIISGKLQNLKAYKIKDYVTMILTSLPGVFLYYVFYYAGAELMSASQAFIVNYMWPIMSVIFACIILKEKMTLSKGIAIAVSFLGVTIATGTDLLHLNQNTVMGAFLCLMGAVSYGIFTALFKKVHYDKGIALMFAYFVTFILTGIVVLVNGDIFIPTSLQIAGFAWNGVISMAAGTILWALALQVGNTAKISNLAYITPFLSLVWTSLILKETITFNSITGLVVIVLGIFIQLKSNSKSNITSVAK